MAVDNNDAEDMFEELTKVALEYGYHLDQVKAHRRPPASGSFTQINIRSDNYMNTRPHHSLVEGIYDV